MRAAATTVAEPARGARADGADAAASPTSRWASSSPAGWTRARWRRWPRGSRPATSTPSPSGSTSRPTTRPHTRGRWRTRSAAGTPASVLTEQTVPRAARRRLHRHRPADLRRHQHLLREPGRARRGNDGGPGRHRRRRDVRRLPELRGHPADAARGRLAALRRRGRRPARLRRRRSGLGARLANGVSWNLLKVAPPQTRWGKVADVARAARDLLGLYQVFYAAFTRETQAVLAAGSVREAQRAQDHGLPAAVAADWRAAHRGQRAAPRGVRAGALELRGRAAAARYRRREHGGGARGARAAPRPRPRRGGRRHRPRAPLLARRAGSSSSATWPWRGSIPRSSTVPSRGFVLPIDAWARRRLQPQMDAVFADDALAARAGLRGEPVRTLWRSFVGRPAGPVLDARSGPSTCCCRGAGSTKCRCRRSGKRRRDGGAQPATRARRCRRWSRSRRWQWRTWYARRRRWRSRAGRWFRRRRSRRSSRCGPTLGRRARRADRRRLPRQPRRDGRAHAERAFRHAGGSRARRGGPERGRRGRSRLLHAGDPGDDAARVRVAGRRLRGHGRHRRLPAPSTECACCRRTRHRTRWTDGAASTGRRTRITENGLGFVLVGPSLPLEDGGLRHGRGAGRARLPPAGPALARVRALDRRHRGDRRGVDRRHPLRRLCRVRGPDARGARRGPRRPARPLPRSRAQLLARRTSPTRWARRPRCGTSSDADPRPRAVLLLPRLRGRPPARRRHRGRLPGGAPLAEEARLRLPGQGGAIRPRRGRDRPRAARRGGVLRQAAPEVRAHVVHLRRHLPALLQLLPQGDPAVAAREAVDARPSSASSSGPTRGRSCSPSTT